MHRHKILSGIVVLLCCLFAAGCSKKVAIGDYDAAEVGKIKKVVPGTIISMRPVRLHSRSEMLAAGTTTNAPSQDNYSENVGKSHGYEYVIRLNSGGIISVVQAEDIKLKTKQRILVIYGRTTRVVPDDGSEDF
ncbi:Uncharacterised protein (plasmid) [Legionella adelaidensis]|uniref:Outer membrane lipoprotein n=1 Tax=Legionella adelaidensis TaxID=45056 RepID=A0A0W0R212_9GAMM|nr:hypothetical protein [Legionella adelaidensis]KTC65066.1 hypothetical protein Lade_1589 [Legionella adelaidensis]VEH85414.1 Uncharacterised protein [Legionella adelaidensis]